MAKKSVKPEVVNPSLYGLRSIETVHEAVDEIVNKLGVSYIEALIVFSEENDIDVEDLGELVKESMNLTEIVKKEAIVSRMVKEDVSEKNQLDLMSCFGEND